MRCSIRTPEECEKWTADKAERVVGDLARAAPAINQAVVRFVPENAAAAGAGIGLAQLGTAVASLGRPGTPGGTFLGKPNPVKLNSAGRMQPYSAAGGRYLSPGANPGLKGSPASSFALGFAEGYVEGMGGGATSAPPPVTKAQEWGQALGKIAQALVERFQR